MPLIRLIRSQQSVAQINCIRRKVSFKTIHCAYLQAFQRHGLVECMDRIQFQRIVEFLQLQIISKADVMLPHFDLMQLFGLKLLIVNNVREATKYQSIQRVKIGILKASSKDIGRASSKEKEQITYL